MATDYYHPTGGRDLRWNGRENRIGYDGTGIKGRGASEHLQDHTAKAGASGHPYNSRWERDNSKDFICPQGTPIYAVFKGTISPVQFGHENGHQNDPPSSDHHGLRLHLVKDDGSNEAYYQHLDRFAPGVAPGKPVEAGQIIGFSGIGGDVPHLHFALQHPIADTYDDWIMPFAPPSDSVWVCEHGPFSPNYQQYRSDPDNPPSPEPTGPVQTPGHANATDATIGAPVHHPGPGEGLPPADFTPSVDPGHPFTPADANASDAAGNPAHMAGIDGAGLSPPGGITAPPEDFDPGHAPLSPLAVPPSDFNPGATPDHSPLIGHDPHPITPVIPNPAGQDAVTPGGDDIDPG